MNRTRGYSAALLTGAVFLVYLNGLRGGFVFDDYAVIVHYNGAHSLSAWWGGLPHGIRPALKLTYVINWISGMGPFGFHLFNVCLHAVNTLLVYLLAIRITQCWRVWPPDAGRHRPALFAALLFALHPLATEAVTYVSGRSASLMSLFFLGSLLAYVRGTQEGKWWWCALVSPLLFVLATGTKETALILPLTLMLWEWARKPERWSGVFGRQAVHWIILLVLIGLVFFNERYGRLIWVSTEIRSLHDNLLSEVNGLTYLLSRLVWVRLNIDPDLPVISAWTPVLAMQLVLLAAMAVGAFLARKKRPWITFGVIWFFLILMPSNSVLPRLDIANERHLYLANFGIFLCIGTEVSGLRILEKRWARAVGIVVLILLACATVVRNNAYSGNTALWEDTALKSPRKSRVFSNLGLSYELDGRIRSAAAMYEKAVRLNPDNEIARNNLSRVKGVLAYGSTGALQEPEGLQRNSGPPPEAAKHGTEP